MFCKVDLLWPFSRGHYVLRIADLTSITWILPVCTPWWCHYTCLQGAGSQRWVVCNLALPSQRGTIWGPAWWPQHRALGTRVSAPVELSAGPPAWLWWHPSPCHALAACIQTTSSEAELSAHSPQRGAPPEVVVCEYKVQRCEVREY